jgi:hypothetical protein
VGAAPVRHQLSPDINPSSPCRQHGVPAAFFAAKLAQSCKQFEPTEQNAKSDQRKNLINQSAQG